MCEMCQIIDRFVYLASPRVHNRTMTTNDTRDRDGIVGGHSRLPC